MSDEHSHQHPPGEPPHEHAPVPSPEPVLPEDAGSRALADALRSSFIIVQVVMVFLVLLFLCSGVFSVGVKERKVILRLGHTVGTGNGALYGPGLHFAFPPPIDEVRSIPYAQTLSVQSTVGWYYSTPAEQVEEAQSGRRPAGRGTLNPLVDGYVIVGDGNVIHARATLYYHVDDPIRYAFDFVNASNCIQSALDSALTYAAAKFTNVDEVLRSERARFQDTVKSRVTDLINQEGLGVAVEQCQLDDIPPLVLTADFENVTTALASYSKLTNDAMSAQFRATNYAATEASRIVSTAETQRRQMITNLAADVKLFTNLLPVYTTNPSLVRQIYLTPVLTKVMTNAGWKWFVPTMPGGPIEVRIQTGPDPQVPKAPTAVNDLDMRLD